MKDFFKPEDFSLCMSGLSYEQRQEIAKDANEKLNKLIESWPVVYCTKLDSEDLNHWTASEKMHIPIDTHKARLAFVEELLKEPCKHEPDHRRTWQNEDGTRKYYCRCGVELKATWTEV